MSRLFRIALGALRFLLFATVFFCHASVFPNPAPQAEQTKPTAKSNAEQTVAVKLEAGKPIERELKGGESHAYEIALAAGEYLNAVVEQKGVDVVVIVIAPDGKTLMEVDSPNGAEGPEPVQFITEAAGVYQVKVNSLDKQASVGKYEIRIKERRKATEADRVAVERYRLLQEATSLNAEATSLQRAGKYGQGAPLAERALAIREKILGAEHPDTVSALGNLAVLYFSKGDYVRAEPLYSRALAISEKVLGAEHAETASALSNLALLYNSMGDYTRGEPLLIRAVAILEKALGSEHPNTAVALNNLALLYYAKGDYVKAEPLLIQAVAIFEKTLGVESPNTAAALSKLAVLYYSKGDYAKAEPLFNRALAIREKVLGARHPNIASVLSNLAVLYRDQGDYTKAIDFQSRCNEIAGRDLMRNLASGSERQKLTYVNQTSLYQDSTIALHTQFAPNDKKAKRAAMQVLLQRKGRALDAMTDAIAALRRRVSPEDQQLLNQLKDVRSQLSLLTLRGPEREGVETHRANLKALEEQEEKLQNAISQRSAEFRAQSQTHSQPVTIEVVQQAIPTGAALVEFAQYRQINLQEPNLEKQFGEPHYAAYLLRNQGEVAWVQLGEAKPIDEAVAQFRKVLPQVSKKEPGKPLSRTSGDVKLLARKLDRLVMQPVRQLLGSTTKVFLSPDGALNLVPFAALVDERGEYLVKRYSFTYLTSGRDLLHLQTRIPSKTAPVVFANADFDKGADKSRMTSENYGPNLGEVGFMPLKRLKASEQEARQLQRTLPQATVLMGEQATEEALKQVASPSILHIATHGYFLEEEVTAESSPTSATRIAVRRKNGAPRSAVPLLTLKIENPLLRSGLFLAGANTGKSGDDDGVLTALEVAGLDLWGTKLVVLSACDTGVGEVKNGDGVYGLRRALVLAGSESQMMSLWEVSDRGTRELMVAYYKRLQAGEGRSEALRNVQLKMLANPHFRHPFYWASFIQSGEWANLDGKR